MSGGRMTIGDIKHIIYTSAALRIPKLDRELPVGALVDLLQDYLVTTAQQRGALEEARLYLLESLYHLDEQWDSLDHQHFLPTKPRHTKEDINRAKKQADPDLHESRREAKFLVDRISDQINRLALDDRAASRTFSMLVGG